MITGTLNPFRIWSTVWLDWRESLRLIAALQIVSKATAGALVCYMALKTWDAIWLGAKTLELLFWIKKKNKVWLIHTQLGLLNPTPGGAGLSATSLYCCPRREVLSSSEHIHNPLTECLDFFSFSFDLVSERASSKTSGCPSLWTEQQFRLLHLFLGFE